MTAIDPIAAAGLKGHPACLMAAWTQAADAGQGFELSSFESQRLMRMRSPERRIELQGSLTLRRQLIASLCGCEPGEVALETGADGAPQLMSPPGWAVSLANKGPLTIVSLAPLPNRIGVDIELIRDIAWRPMLSMICNDAERAATDSALKDETSAPEIFFRMWTLKEAVLKSTGQGFRAGPKLIETPVALLVGPGAGQLSAFGERFEFWTAGNGDYVVSLVRRLD